MIHNTYSIGKKGQILVIFLFCFLLGLSTSRAEGSKDLYPQNARGVRLHLNTMNYAHFNYGTHFVYAEEGEQIAIASDAQQNGTRKIFLYAPDGTQILLPLSGQIGNIPNRTAELAGPLLPDQEAGSNRYLPVYYTVPVGGTGIYKVDFHGYYDPNATPPQVYQHTPANQWPAKPIANQPNLTGNVVAWDVSIAKKVGSDWTWVNGRTYTNTLNLVVDGGVYSGSLSYIIDFKFKMLTYAGYLYSVQTNDMMGSGFWLWVNNIGISKEGQPNVPSYLSWPRFSTAAEMGARHHNPNLPDTEFISTAKIFYSLPDRNMPAKARWAQTGQETWLNEKEQRAPDANTVVTVVGANETSNKIGRNGGYIKFDNQGKNEYEIVIKPKSEAPSSFPQRILRGMTTSGENQIFWDGKDGAGHFVTAKQVDVQVTVKSPRVETHFMFPPFTYNKNGMIIELLSEDFQTVRSDRVYWDDTLIDLNTGANVIGRSHPINASHFVNPAGTSSRLNGHRWGEGNNIMGAPVFGYNRLMDTWAFVEGGTFSKTVEVEMKVADLAITAVTADQTIVSKDDSITYIVKVINHGPTAVEGATFTFDIPTGFEPLQAQFSGNTCGTEDSAITFNTMNQTYTATLDLGIDCEVSYTIQLKAINPTAGPIKVEASILRPDDYYDPDATNLDPAIPPTDAHYECENNGLSTPCNNIKENQEVIFTLAEFRLIKDGVFNDVNNDRSPQVGETITYTIQLTNTGETKLMNLVLTDSLLGGVITAVPEKSINADDFLDVNEVWTYTLIYVITQSDLDNQGVYNQAKVQGIEEGSNQPLEKKSRPTVLLTPTDPGYDPNRKEHSFVLLRVNNLLITNPMVRQRVKK